MGGLVRSLHCAVGTRVTRKIGREGGRRKHAGAKVLRRSGELFLTRGNVQQQERDSERREEGERRVERTTYLASLPSAHQPKISNSWKVRVTTVSMSKNDDIATLNTLASVASKTLVDVTL